MQLPLAVRDQKAERSIIANTCVVLSTGQVMSRQWADKSQNLAGEGPKEMGNLLLKLEKRGSLLYYV